MFESRRWTLALTPIVLSTLVVASCRGPRGFKGDPGDPGAPGERGEPGERGQRGPEGPRGPQGPPGSPGGLMCWDLNGDGAPQPNEDQNADGLFDARDCRGPRGLKGDPGDPGNPGERGEQGERGERGPEGAEGPEGPEGPPGASLTSCREIRFPATQQTFGNGSSRSAECAADELAISCSCGSSDWLKVIYPSNRSAGCECFQLGFSCVLAREVGVVRCCK